MHQTAIALVARCRILVQTKYGPARDASQQCPEWTDRTAPKTGNTKIRCGECYENDTEQNAELKVWLLEVEKRSAEYGV
jgi:hypothetical protein